VEQRSCDEITDPVACFGAARPHFEVLENGAPPLHVWDGLA